MKYNQPGTIFYREAQRMQREGAKKVQKAGTGLSETDVGGTAGTDGSAAGTRKRRRDGGDGGPESKVAKTGNGGDVATAASNTIQIDSDAVSRDAVLLLADPMVVQLLVQHAIQAIQGLIQRQKQPKDDTNLKGLLQLLQVGELAVSKKLSERAADEDAEKLVLIREPDELLVRVFCPIMATLVLNHSELAAGHATLQALHKNTPKVLIYPQLC
jgi:hypothetical protein